jgi:hypothetical protein
MTQTTGKSFATCLCAVRIVPSFKSDQMRLVLAKSVLERLQQGYGNVRWRTPLPHLGDDLTLPLHVCLTLSDVALNHL